MIQSMRHTILFPLCLGVLLLGSDIINFKRLLPLDEFEAYDDIEHELEQILLINQIQQQQDAKQRNESLVMQSFVKQWLNETNEPPQTPGAFVHIGKSGGSTLSRYLRNGCHRFMEKPCERKDLYNESFVSKLTTYYHTPDFRFLGSEPHKFYVITLRDPLSKLKSMFTFMHPANIRLTVPRRRNWEDAVKVYSCFPTLESFAEMLGDAPLQQKYPKPDLDNLYQKEDCSNLAMAVMSGHRRIEAVNHFYWGISTIHKKLKKKSPSFNNATILAIRQEHLWDDWKSANEYLGQQNVVIHENTRARDYSNISLPVTKELSEQGQRKLCLALNDEYDKYLQFLQRASNLDDNAKQASLELAQANCPWLNLTLTI